MQGWKLGHPHGFTTDVFSVAWKLNMSFHQSAPIRNILKHCKFHSKSATKADQTVLQAAANAFLKKPTKKKEKGAKASTKKLKAAESTDAAETS